MNQPRKENNATNEGVVSSTSPPPYSEHPPDYWPAQNERTPLLPLDHAESASHCTHPKQKKRVNVLAALGGIAVLAIVVVVLLRSKHSPPSYQEPIYQEPSPINCSIGVIGTLSKTFELA